MTLCRGQFQVMLMQPLHELHYATWTDLPPLIVQELGGALGGCAPVVDCMPKKISKSSIARHGETSANLQFLLRVTSLCERFTTVIGTHLSPHRGVTMRPTNTSLGLTIDMV